MSIDMHFFGATVAEMFYFLSIVQGSSYIICPVAANVHCQNKATYIVVIANKDIHCCYCQKTSTVVDNFYSIDRRLS